MKKNYAIAMAGLFIQMSLMAQTDWYVNLQNGSNSNDGTTPSTPFKTVKHALKPSNGFVQPGDTVWLMGTFSNSSYDPNYVFTGNISDPHIWHAENSIKINNVHGAPGNYISFKSYENTAVLKGDGANILRISNSSYLRIEGLEVFGEVNNIPYSTAKELQFLWDSLGVVVHRVPPGTPDTVVEHMTFPVLGSVSRPSYTDTRGIYLSNVYHMEILNNVIHHTPGGGLRVSDCDYIDIKGNEIHNCSRKSFSGTHALVVTKATSIDTHTGYKINIERNKVHHNYNEIYSWAPTKSIITPFIDEGKGISLQRNDTLAGRTWTHGRFLVANNLCYRNGYSGVHSNSGMRIDFINNTCYHNSYTKSVTYPTSTTGGNIGISTAHGDDIRMINNISIIDSDLNKSALAASNTINLVVADNLIYGTNGPISEDPDIVAVQTNTTMADPLFVDTTNDNFGLQSSSPAIGIANASESPVDDYFQRTRDAHPDLGAIEYFSSPRAGQFNFNVSKDGSLSNADLLIYPNPCSDKVSIQGVSIPKNLRIYDVMGNDRTHSVRIGAKTSKVMVLDLSNLGPGLYLVKETTANKMQNGCVPLLRLR